MWTDGLYIRMTINVNQWLINCWVQNVYGWSVGCKMYITEQAGHEKWKMWTHDCVIVGCKMYMTEVLDAKGISQNNLDMKNEK